MEDVEVGMYGKPIIHLYRGLARVVPGQPIPEGHLP
jgi:hypothetical protein